MLIRLFVLFILLTLCELAILVWIAERTSTLFTIGLVLFTGFLGAVLARIQGLRTIRRIHDDLRADRMPADALVDGLLILIASVLLVTPGVITDSLGFALLVPAFRRWMKRRVKRRFARRFPASSYWRTPGRSEVIDAKIISEESDEP